jgi:o-succinylbenzoate---CoA ligase
MDPIVLADPVFWTSARPFAPAGWAGEMPEDPRLDGHVLFETSGSSGKPKWIALSKNALLLSAAAVNRHLNVTEDSSWGLALPLHHVGGFGVAARAFEAACEMQSFSKRWDPAAFRDWLEKTRVTHTSLVPTQVHDLVTTKRRAPGSLTAIVVGGGHLDEATGRAARDLGWPVLASYGMTEAGSQIATQGLEQLETPYRSAPIPLLPIWKAKVSEDQILQISGPALFSGTLMGEAGCWKFSPRETEWHRTSDRVVLENRELSPRGRADSLVKVLGELVDPESIEHELLVLSRGRLKPGDFAVAAVPDERAEHRLIPVFDARCGPAQVFEILANYQKEALGYRRLAEPVFWEKLPRSPLGKILRAQIRERLKS